jgi:hypothetical protein
MPKVRFTADLESGLFAWVETYKTQKDISRNEVIRRAVQSLKKEQFTSGERVENGKGREKEIHF